MQKDYGLRNPIEVEQPMQKHEFTKYIKICAEQRESGKPTDPEIIEEIHRSFYASHPLVNKKKLDDLWEKVEPWLLESEGLAQSILDYDGEKSDYFFAWLVSMHTSMSMALEAAYNAGYDLEGNWVTDIPHEDSMSYYVYNEPPYVSARRRGSWAATLAASTIDAVLAANLAAQSDILKMRLEPGRDKVIDAKVRAENAGRKAKIVDLGAGRMAWARWHGLELNPDLVEIIASDRDETIVPEDLFPGGPEKYGIKYERANLFEQLKNPECQHADLVLLLGVASYYPREALVEVFKGVYELLNPGGEFACDFQVNGLPLQRSTKVFGWPELKLKDTVAETIEVIEGLRAELWEAGVTFDVSYRPDIYDNRFQSAVIVTLTKV